ncbi:uncharacterized, partial [Tachysurus ichikawai]
MMITAGGPTAKDISSHCRATYTPATRCTTNTPGISRVLTTMNGSSMASAVTAESTGGQSAAYNSDPRIFLMNI